MKKILIILVLIFTSCSESSNWYKLELEKENSKIQFPSKPVESFQTKKIKGVELPVKMFIHQTEKKNAKNLAYIFGTTIYPDSLVTELKNKKDSILEFTARGSIDKESMKMISLKKIKLGQVEGRELKLNYMNGESIMATRFYLNGKFMYVLMTITEPEYDSNYEQNKFFESFQILK